jgi:stalled ribosome rescue protein Dom34
VNSYPNLTAAIIGGNPEETPDEELGRAARVILDELYAAELAELVDRMASRAAHGRAVTDLSDVARAATYGAVETLFVDIDQSVPGLVDEETGAVTLSDSEDAVSYGVVDEIARRVWLSGGRVLAVRREDIPAGGSVAAILRYAL